MYSSRARLAPVPAPGAAAAGALTRASSRHVRLTHHRLAWPLERPVRVLHLTDLHVGWATHPQLLEQAVVLAHRIKPDVLVMTGDYLNRSLRYLGRLRRIIARLPRPCVATLGNHDYWSGERPIRAALEARGVHVLCNESTRLRVAGGALRIVGVDDGHTRRDDAVAAMRGVRHPERALVLSHYPKTVAAIAEQGGRLVLSGHTHGGQLDIPVVTRTITQISGNQYIAGWYAASGARLYVNAGIGAAVIRWRVGRRAAPEAAVIDLVPAARG